MTFHYHSSYTTLLIFSTILFLSQLSQVTSTSPYLLPIIKDSSKPQYYTSFLLGTPSFRVSISIDLSNPWSWFTCNIVGFNTTTFSPVPNSSTYRALRCSNATCDPYDSHFCSDCVNTDICGTALGKTCGAEQYGPYHYTHNVDGTYVAPLILDVITIYNNRNASPKPQQLPNFPFGCGYKPELKGLSSHSKGILSLARKDSSLPNLISKTFNVPRKFALCMPSSSKSGVNGAMYFGGGPYFSPLISFATTPLVVNPIDIGVTSYKDKTSVDYFINVKSILVDGTPIKIDSNLLTINKNNGIGGTKLSTMDGYTVLHTQIYNALVSTFSSKAAALNLTRVGPVSSFKTCFNTKNIVGTRTGPKGPIIDLVLDGNSKWRIYGANSMIKVSNDVRCLAFIDGGSTVKTSVVIGGKQMEDNLIEFDLESSELSVTSSLLKSGTSCSQFKGVK